MGCSGSATSASVPREALQRTFPSGALWESRDVGGNIAEHMPFYFRRNKYLYINNLAWGDRFIVRFRGAIVKQSEAHNEILEREVAAAARW